MNEHQKDFNDEELRQNATKFDLKMKEIGNCSAITKRKFVNQLIDRALQKGQCVINLHKDNIKMSIEGMSEMDERAIRDWIKLLKSIKSISDGYTDANSEKEWKTLLLNAQNIGKDDIVLNRIPVIENYLKLTAARNSQID